MNRAFRYLLSLGSGVLAALPWLGASPFVLMVAFVPLMVLNSFFIQNKHRYAAKEFVGHVFLAALVWNVLAAWWMLQAAPFAVFAAMCFNALLMAMVAGAIHLIHRNFSTGLAVIAYLAFWISFEYLQFNWDLEWPCLQLGSVWGTSPKLVQWYEFTGAPGGSVWMLLSNLLFYAGLWVVIRKAGIGRLILAVLCELCIIFLPIKYSLDLYHHYAEKDLPVHAAIVQPNVDPYTEKFDWNAEGKKLETFLQLAETVCDDRTDLLVGPETIFEHVAAWNEDSLERQVFLERMSSFVERYPRAELLLGASTFKCYSSAESAPITARTRKEGLCDYFSTALFVSRDRTIQLYHKSKLVMGVEKIPFLRYLPFLKKWYLDLGGAAGGLGVNERATNFITSAGVPFAPVICFESVFGAYVAEFVRQGAEFLVVITNDGWWKGSRGYKQHLVFSQLRAIETRRSIIRAANTGVSGFINQRGELVEASDWWVPAALSGLINRNDRVTFYVAQGDYLGRMAVVTSVFLLAMGFAVRFRKRF